MTSQSKRWPLIMLGVLVVLSATFLMLRFGPMASSDPHRLYDYEYFKGIHASSLSSAQATVPLVIQWVHPASVIDLGCGEGSWLSVFLKSGVKDIQGVDGEWMTPSLLQIPHDRFQVSDLRQPYRQQRKFDLAMSLEVAEHLPSEDADMFVESLTGLAPVVLFSAGIPSSDPTNPYHVNEQWPRYWSEKFARRDYVPVDCLREAIWENPAVAPWYKETIVLYARKDWLGANPPLSAEYAKRKGSYPPLVHPDTLADTLRAVREPPLRYILPRLPERIVRRIIERARSASQ